METERLPRGRRGAGPEFAFMPTRNRQIFRVQTTSPTKEDIIFTPCILCTGFREKSPNYSSETMLQFEFEWPPFKTILCLNTLSFVGRTVRED